MSLHINLIIHGVPMGQKIWGSKNEDVKYISSFYGPNWDLPEVMKIEPMTSGGITYCFYTFLKGQNVYDNQGRAGSYFAITLKTNAYYADIRNIYCVLKAAYEKMCVGLCISETHGASKFLLTDFQNIGIQLKDIEEHILNYISVFSVNDDIIDIQSLPISNKEYIQNVNLHECTKQVALDCIRESGKILVSPYFLSSNATNTITKYQKETQEAREWAKTEILQQQKKSRDEIQYITQRYQDEKKETQENYDNLIIKTKEECQRRIAEIKDSYAEVDSKIDTLKRKLKEREQEINELKSKCRKKDKEIQAYNKVKQRMENDIFQSKQFVENETPSYKNKNKQNKKCLYLLFFLICLTLLFTSWVIFHKFSSVNKGENEVTDIIEQQTTNSKERLDVLPTATTMNSSKELKPYIIIKELTNNEHEIRVGEQYHIKIQNIEAKDGKFISDEFAIYNDVIMAKREYIGKEGTIKYQVGGNNVASIKLNIK